MHALYVPQTEEPRRGRTPFGSPYLVWQYSLACYIYAAINNWCFACALVAIHMQLRTVASYVQHVFTHVHWWSDAGHAPFSYSYTHYLVAAVVFLHCLFNICILACFSCLSSFMLTLHKLYPSCLSAVYTGSVALVCTGVNKTRHTFSLLLVSSFINEHNFQCYWCPFLLTSIRFNVIGALFIN